jgi:hypothetical protein
MRLARGSVFNPMKKKPDKTDYTSTRVDLSPAVMKQIDAKRKKLSPIPKLKPFVEALIEQQLQFKPQPEGER